jgi:hypothetical protein
MWWRVLGVAVVLLCVGVAGGYAVADRTAGRPASSDVLEPVPAVSPSVPTPPAFDVLPDPDAEPLQPDLPSHPEELRVTRRGAGASVLVPDGWRQSRLDSGQTWTFVPEINRLNTYGLRVDLMVTQRLAADVAKVARIAALESAEANGHIEGLEVTAETGESFEATYIDQGYRRVTMERWVAHDDGTAYVDVAVTGRVVDTEGLRDLLARTARSVSYLEPLEG